MKTLKFIVDENIPGLVKASLAAAGHDVVSPLRGSSDLVAARNAKREGRIILTLDKDFTNTVLFPPTEFTIIHVAIHPPEKNSVLRAVMALLATERLGQFKGLYIVSSQGYARIEK